ncbi:MAG: shikimate kinase, partial [Pseudomonadota bacterium]
RAAVLWLRADLELLWNRVKHRDTRPLLRTADPKATLTELFEARQPAYAKAPLAIDVAADWSIEETCDAVQAALIAAGVIARTDTAKGV